MDAGQNLAHYEILAKIGIGGMGEVYRARDERLDRDVAIKVLPASVAQDAGRIARFEREVQLTSQLNHPNTIAIYDYGRTPEGVFYYAMEYLNGINLQDLVDQAQFQGLLGGQDGGLVDHVAGLVMVLVQVGSLERRGVAFFDQLFRGPAVQPGIQIE